MLTLVGCNAQHTARVNTDDGYFSGAGGYEAHPYRAATHAAEVAFYRAMGKAYDKAEHAAQDGKARTLFRGLRKGWKGFGYIAAGQGGHASVPGYTGNEMNSALRSLPDDICQEVTSDVAEAYDALYESLKRGATPKHAAAAKGAKEYREDWLYQGRNRC